MKYYYHVLAAVLTGGCILNPMASAFGLLFILAAKISEIYLTPKPNDKDETEFIELKNEFQKLKAKSDQESLGKAFARGNV